MSFASVGKYVHRLIYMYTLTVPAACVVLVYEFIRDACLDSVS